MLWKNNILVCSDLGYLIDHKGYYTLWHSVDAYQFRERSVLDLLINNHDFKKTKDKIKRECNKPRSLMGRRLFNAYKISDQLMVFVSLLPIEQAVKEIRQSGQLIWEWSQ